MSELQVATAQDVITDAMVLMLAQTPGEPIAASEMMFGLRELNRMTGKHSIIRTFCYNISQLPVFTFASSKNNYTIGPIGADFTAGRPTRVLRANLIDNTVNPVVYLPIRICQTFEEWAALQVRQIATTIPTILYYDNSYTSVGLTAGVPNPGFGTLWFWGQPKPGYQVELWVPTLLTNFTAISGPGSYFTFPPGYEEFVVTSLAEVLCISYGRPITPDLARRARRARAAIVSVNSKSPLLETDVPNSSTRSGEYFNWLSGGF